MVRPGMSDGRTFDTAPYKYAEQAFPTISAEDIKKNPDKIMRLNEARLKVESEILPH